MRCVATSSIKARKAFDVLFTRRQQALVCWCFVCFVVSRVQVVAIRDKLVRRVQQRWRRRMWNKTVERRRGEAGNSNAGASGTGAHPMIRPTTEAFSFSPPEELNERMMLCTAWAYLRRGSLLVREVRYCFLAYTYMCRWLAAAESLRFATAVILHLGW